MPRPSGPCLHTPRCPGASAPDRDAARVVIDHAEQDWVVLCNGVVRFDDRWDLLPDGSWLPAPVSGHRSSHVSAA